MSGEENPKLVNVDPQCIKDSIQDSVQEALRMYLQPIKNDDPKIDFYTIYKRETMEYDTQYLQKYSEDLSTTLIFAGLFSAVSTAFIIDVQSKLEPDSSDRSEVYLRAILLSLNRSISPDEDPTVPPAWSGPPQEIVTTSNLLYASLLMSLLAAFIAMLGKQWLNRYLRHTGGSMIERCGDRQRKFDGLEKWPFRLFIESLPIMLQIALLLLICGLSRYMWSINTSVARVVISFTVLGFVLYIGIVVAGTSSHECPFQTPMSMVLRHLRGSKTARKWLSPTNIVSSILSGLRSIAKEIGHLVITLLCLMFPNTRVVWRRLIQGRRVVVLPHYQPSVPHTVPGLRNLKGLQRQNTDDGSCICWVLRNITEPETIDTAIRLAGIIRWFDGDTDHNPQFDVIVSTFEACFDSTKQLYPETRDRAYFSAQAILQINMRARVRIQDHTSKYPIPVVSTISFKDNDPDLHHLIQMLQENLSPTRPTLYFPDGDKNTYNYSLWLSNLFVDLAHVGPNPTLRSYKSYLTVASSNHQAIIANILLMWDMLLGGQIEEETVWAIDKSDSLGKILSHLSATVMDIIANGNCVRHLDYLLGFLAAWKGRPAYLTPIAYQWCSAFSGVVTETREQVTYLRQPRQLSEEGFTEVGPGCDLVRHGRSCQRDIDPHNYMDLLFKTLEIGFRQAHFGLGQPTIHLDHTSHHDRMFQIAFSSKRDGVIADAVCAWIADSKRAGSLARHFTDRVEWPEPFSPLLRQIGIRAIYQTWSNDFTMAAQETIRLLNCLKVDVDDVEEDDDWVDRLIAVIRSQTEFKTSTGFERLSSHYWSLLGKLMAIGGYFWEFASDDLKVMESLEKAKDWEKLEVWMAVIWMAQPFQRIRMPESMEDIPGKPKYIPALEPRGYIPTPESMEGVERATLELFLRQPSALQRIENLCKSYAVWESNPKLQEIFNQARTKQLPLEPLPPS